MRANQLDVIDDNHCGVATEDNWLFSSHGKIMHEPHLSNEPFSAAMSVMTFVCFSIEHSSKPGASCSVMTWLSTGG